MYSSANNAFTLKMSKYYPKFFNKSHGKVADEQALNKGFRIVPR